MEFFEDDLDPSFFVGRLKWQLTTLQPFRFWTVFFCICDLSISESSKQSAAGSNRQFFASDQPPAVEASIQHPFEPLPPIFVDVF